MGLINQDFRSLTLKGFDGAVAGLNSFSFVYIPLLAGYDEAIIECVSDIKLAKEAIGKIKRQVYGTGEPYGAVDFEMFPLEKYDETVAGMLGLAMVVMPSFAVEIGFEAVAEYAIACMIAKDAVIEIKQQVYSVESDV
jgi:hypothetical protein